MLEPAIGAEDDIRPDDTVRPDDCSCAEFGARIDDCRWMDLRIAHRSRNVNMSSPSETMWSFTTQVQRAFARRLLRALISSAVMKSVSPGMTGLRNFTSSALMKYPMRLRLFALFLRIILANCAMASTFKTPGITG